MTEKLRLRLLGQQARDAWHRGFEQVHPLVHVVILGRSRLIYPITISLIQPAFLGQMLLESSEELLVQGEILGGVPPISPKA